MAGMAGMTVEEVMVEEVTVEEVVVTVEEVEVTVAAVVVPARGLQGYPREGLDGSEG